jgi:hypothetical protein
MLSLLCFVFMNVHNILDLPLRRGYQMRCDTYERVFPIQLFVIIAS